MAVFRSDAVHFVDCGASYMFESLRPDTEYPVYATRGEIAAFLVAKSPKLQFLVGKLATWAGSSSRQEAPSGSSYV